MPLAMGQARPIGTVQAQPDAQPVGTQAEKPGAAWASGAAW